ncbi:MAG TPA: sigma-54-dependent Fis family transcriptional regulator [Nitrospirae bacterium]|nr:sigma-54-dependent Fis family transcriptional regulator [Nitrospirota bacterium]
MEKQLLLLSSGEETVSHVRKTLEPLKYRITVKNKLSAGLKAMTGSELVLLDMPDSVKALREIKSYCPEATVLVAAEPDQANLALDDGAYHFLKKPIRAHELRSVVKNAQQSISMRSKLDHLRGFGPPKLILGMGASIKNVIRQIKRAASKDISVLIVGENGSGKMLVADAIHRMSARRLETFFVASECSGGGLFEALVGDKKIPGGLLAAEGGIIVYKDLHGLSVDEQKKVAEHMKNGLPLPGDSKADVRVLATTESYKKGWPFSGRFRSIIHLPALRERKEDIAPLAGNFIKETAELLNGDEKTLSSEALKALKGHNWPGNVGELKNTVRRAYLLCRDKVIEPCHISTEDGSTYCTIKDFFDAKLTKYIRELVKVGKSGLYGTVMDEVEKTLIELVLRETGGNQVKTSNTLGITRTTLRTKMRNYGLNGSGSSRKK